MTDDAERDVNRALARELFTDPDRPAAIPKPTDPASDDDLNRQYARALFAPSAEEPTR